MSTRTCPDCGQTVETVQRGPFRVECWPTHNSRRITRDYKTMTPAEINAWRADHRDSGHANQTDRCPASGQPV